MNDTPVSIYIGIEAPVFGRKWEPLKIEVHPNLPVGIRYLQRLTVDLQTRQSTPSWVGLIDRSGAVRLISTDPAETYHIGQLAEIMLDFSPIPFTERVLRWLDSHPGKTHYEAIRQASQARFGAIC